MTSRSMKPTYRLVSALLLLGWLFATGVILLEHGGAIGPGYVTEATDHSRCDEKPGHEVHPHDVATTSRPADQSVSLSPILSGSVDKLSFGLLVARLRAIRPSEARSEVNSWPLDERSSGWLFVCRTARPIRAPVIVA